MFCFKSKTKLDVDSERAFDSEGRLLPLNELGPYLPLNKIKPLLTTGGRTFGRVDSKANVCLRMALVSQAEKHQSVELNSLSLNLIHSHVMLLFPIYKWANHCHVLRP